MPRDRNGFSDGIEDQDEAYFDSLKGRGPVDRGFDTRLLHEPASILPARKPVVLGPASSVTDAIRAMKGEHRGVVLVTEDGTPGTPIIGIFSERDVLFRVVDGGRNPATLALSEVMTPDPECLDEEGTIADTLNQMSVGGFRHVPIVDGKGRPTFVVSVRDIVQFLVDAFPREILNQSGDRQSQREGG
ncbi:MAG: CBS domain-containing protein [Deltaproteobacteria bacterium]|nr:CBS domain-containing protein [Deltaproteobacteria bacterium]MBW2393250.1 CBS domain-containing protein [Deltaproteobacteria bacterium]